EDQQLFDRLAETRSQLAGLILKAPGPDNPEAYRTQLAALEETAERLESELSSRSREFGQQLQPATIAAVQAALPAGGALIEFAVYTPEDLRTGKRQSPRYLVYLLTAQGSPRWADLGEAAPIDLAIGLWRKALRDPQRADVKRLARAVDDRVMRPIRSLLEKNPGGTLQLLIAPDGLLNLVPFAALVDEQNRYLVERYSISYLTSGRDLLRASSSQPNRNEALIVANPAFGPPAIVAAKPADREAGTQGQVRIDSTQLYFRPLPYTDAEAEAIKTLVPGARMLRLRAATETAVKQARAPRILHIATHGFFLNSPEAPPERSNEDPRRWPDLRLGKWALYVKDPLLRSGLALAGANRGVSADDDGVLTALEVAGLDLWGTELVVLSACDTGVGEVKNGDGVYGLRRALVLAGSETQIMSLWPVSDQATRDLMVSYYRGLTQGQGRGEALRLVQLEMLKDLKRQHPFYWASFIQSGEWTKLEAP
ncbi:MAG TPA: CHAT domain-containing protein, partial [Blastocatellia bacterium]|nr:CHAT domain-containing protein [Blastocatellia bacterium]